MNKNNIKWYANTLVFGPTANPWETQELNSYLSESSAGMRATFLFLYDSLRVNPDVGCERANPLKWRFQAPTWCRTPSSPTHWVQASSGTQLPSSMTWCWGQKQPSEGWSPQELVFPSQCRGQPRSQWLYTRDGGHGIAADREWGHSPWPTPARSKRSTTDSRWPSIWQTF